MYPILVCFVENMATDKGDGVVGGVTTMIESPTAASDDDDRHTCPHLPICQIGRGNNHMLRCSLAAPHRAARYEFIH